MSSENTQKEPFVLGKRVSKKIIKNDKIYFLEKNCSVEKLEGPFPHLKRISLTEYKEKFEGNPLMKNFDNCTMPKNLLASYFEDMLKNMKNSNEVLFTFLGYPLELQRTFLGYPLELQRKVCKNCAIQSEVSGPTKNLI